MAISVRRDPFARGEYHRICVGAGTCDWCGQERKRLFTYAWTSDSAMVYQHTRRGDGHAFCNVQCFLDYHS